MGWTQYHLFAILHCTLATVHLKLLPFELLLRDFLLLRFIRWNLGECLLFFNETNLNVAWRGHVRIDSSVSTVSPPSHLGGTVDLDVVNNQMVSVESLILGIGFGVLQKMKQELGRLLGPTTLRCTVNFSLGMTTDTTHESSKGNDFLFGDDIFQVSGGPVKRHLLDSLSRLSGVLEMVNS